MPGGSVKLVSTRRQLVSLSGVRIGTTAGSRASQPGIAGVGTAFIAGGRIRIGICDDDRGFVDVVAFADDRNSVNHGRFERSGVVFDFVYCVDTENDIDIFYDSAKHRVFAVKGRVGLMRDKKLGCLPVVKDGDLIGMITEMEFLRISGRLIERLEKED